jgi:dihydroorotate dehydrogenase (NAD+) catalytic subunit
MADLSIKICGKTFKNPVIAASGTFGFGREYAEIYNISLLGGICTKGITLNRREGNPAPRIAETASGILNSVGLQNPGVRAFVDIELAYLRQHNTVIIANVAGSCESDYCQTAEIVSSAGVDMIELNISCPNVKEGGLAFGSKPESIEKITAAVKKSIRGGVPLIVKLSPNVTSISDCAKAAEGGGADCISLINTIGGMAVDIKTRKPVLANVFGGLSGPCVKPVALKMVYESSKAVKIPIIGMGGIMCARDAVEFMLCGATAVMVGTANISRPKACLEIAEGLNQYCENNGIKKISEITGGLIV